MDLDRILASVPANKQTAIVVSNVSDYESELRQLVAQSQYLHDALKMNKTYKHLSKERVIELKEERRQTNEKISLLKKDFKLKRKGNIEWYFMEACREMMSRPAFEMYLKAALKNRENEGAE